MLTNTETRNAKTEKKDKNCKFKRSKCILHNNTNFNTHFEHSVLQINLYLLKKMLIRREIKAGSE